MTTTFGTSPSGVRGHQHEDGDEESVDPADVEIEDGEDAGPETDDDELDEPVQGNLLTNSFKGPKPVRSILNVGSIKRSFGDTRQFNDGDVIEARIRIEVTAAGRERMGKQKIVTRMHKAKILDFDIIEG